MHEMSLMESVIEIACDVARRNGASEIREIRLRVGMLSHVDARALSFCHEAVRHGTIAANARLSIDHVPGRGWCLDCGKAVALTERFGACPDCGRHRVQMTAGDELSIQDLEVI